MESSWPRRAFLGALILVGGFLYLRHSQKRSQNAELTAWGSSSAPGNSLPRSDAAPEGQPQLSAPERALSSVARMPGPEGMSVPDRRQDFVDPGPGGEAASNDEPQSLEAASGGAWPAQGFSGAGAGSAASAGIPTFDDAAGADGKIPGGSKRAQARGSGYSGRPNSGNHSRGGSGLGPAAPAAAAGTGEAKGGGQASVASGRKPSSTALRNERGSPASLGREAENGGGASQGASPTGSKPSPSGAPSAGPGRAVLGEDDSESAFLASARGVLPQAAPPPPPVSGRPVAAPPTARRTIPSAEDDEGAGTLSAEGGTVGAKRFATDRNKDAAISVRRLPNGAVAFTADMDIVADGAGGHYKADLTGQAETALQYPGGQSLNPGSLPFIVVPLDFHKSYPDVKLGDFAAVTYNGRTMFAIVGDKGPTGVVGEGSIHLAQSLGIPADPNKGGVGGGVQYVIIPGSGGQIPRTAEEVRARGEELFRSRGLMQ